MYKKFLGINYTESKQTQPQKSQIKVSVIWDVQCEEWVVGCCRVS